MAVSRSGSGLSDHLLPPVTLMPPLTTSWVNDDKIIVQEVGL